MVKNNVDYTYTTKDGKTIERKAAPCFSEISYAEGWNVTSITYYPQASEFSDEEVIEYIEKLKNLGFEAHIKITPAEVRTFRKLEYTIDCEAQREGFVKEANKAWCLANTYLIRNLDEGSGGVRRWLDLCRTYPDEDPWLLYWLAFAPYDGNHKVFVSFNQEFRPLTEVLENFKTNKIDPVDSATGYGYTRNNYPFIECKFRPSKPSAKWLTWWTKHSTTTCETNLYSSFPRTKQLVEKIVGELKEIIKS